MRFCELQILLHFFLGLKKCNKKCNKKENGKWLLQFQMLHFFYLKKCNCFDYQHFKAVFYNVALFFDFHIELEKKELSL